MALVSAKRAEELTGLRMEIETMRNQLEKAEAKLQERIEAGGSSVRELDLAIVKLRRELYKLEKRHNDKLKRSEVSPELEGALKNPAPAQQRFWTYGRKDMYQ